MNKTCWFSVCLLLFLQACGQPPHYTTEKYYGLSLVGTSEKLETEMLVPVLDLKANSVTLMPFAYGKLGSPDLQYKDLRWQWWGESFKGVEASIQTAQHAGLDVVIKPQLWLDWGSFTGDHELESEEDWQQFEKSYREYILPHAELSQKYQLPLFCIGTELCRFTELRPDFWTQLIKDIRAVYSGKLTYASNWDSYKRCPFWSEVDYIGLDAYFPLNDARVPEKENLNAAWIKWHNELESFAEEKGKPILFTEWGYRSVPFTAKAPWESGRSQEVDLLSQKVAYEALIERFKDEPWFAGGFVWKWYPNHTQVGGPEDNRFTPQNKPAQEVLKEWFHQAKQ